MILRHSSASCCFGAEHMRVVLGKAAHAHQAVHRARRLVAMHHAEFGEPQRQVAIALQAVLEDLHMAGAVHRLQRKPALVLGLVAGRLRREHVLAVPVPMARGFPQRLVEDLRRVDLAVVAGQPPAHIGDQRLEDGPALGVPEHHAGAFFLEVKQVELAAELAVVALLGFLDLLQIERRGLPASRTPCRRCASASDCCCRRANRRRPPSSA